jgi:hypothetical protein
MSWWVAESLSASPPQTPAKRCGGRDRIRTDTISFVASRSTH